MANGPLENIHPELIRQLTPEDVLHRLLLKAKHLEFLEQAFIRRESETGLSVCFDCSPQDCFNFSVDINRSYGVASLIVSDVTSLALTVIPDAAHHAEIQGVPSVEEDARKAEFIATQLAKIATIVDKTTRKRT